MAARTLKDVRRCFCILFIFIVQIVSHKTGLIHLNEDNWSQMLDGEWMVEFFAPWCPACKAMQPMWEEFSTWSKDLDINVAQVDVTSNPGLSGRFMVTALPTIFHVKEGQFRQYRGSRDREAFINFIEDKKWESVDKLSNWYTPSSIQMSIVSYFFKLSMILRNIHTQLVEQYHFPFWASILTFAIVTIAVGAILGLMLVCVVDMLFPPKHRHTQTQIKPPTLPPKSPASESEDVNVDSEEEAKSSKEEQSSEQDNEENAAKPENSGAESSPKANEEKVRKRKKNKKAKIVD